jgi:TPP-dependent pyruvate/acetoin dehydrogenase alpha subunit
MPRKASEDMRRKLAVDRRARELRDLAALNRVKALRDEWAAALDSAASLAERAPSPQARELHERVTRELRSRVTQIDAALQGYR